MPQIPFAFEFECEWPNDLCVAELPFSCSEMFVPFLFKTVKWQFGQTFQNKKKFIFLSVKGRMVIQMTCVWPKCHSAIHTQTQTETEGYRMHVQRDYA